MRSEFEERLFGFLKAISDASEKYGLVIGGCGCCGSPYIEDLKREYKNYQYPCDNLHFDEEKNTYVVTYCG